MVSTIILTKNNVVNSDNNLFVYKFPTSIALSNHKISCGGVSMYYSWTNINSSTLANNTFTYTWTVAGALNTYTVTIPDGCYQISDINNYLQQTFIKNGHYLINSTGSYVYYAELIVSTTSYGIQVNTYLVPTSLPVGYTAPSGFAGYPTTSITPVLTFPSGFSSILGFPANTATTSSTTTTQSIISGVSGTVAGSVAPQVQPNPTVFFTCNFIQNSFGNPNNILYTVTPTVPITTQIVDRPFNYIWNPILKGTYNQLAITILGTNFTPIKNLDPNVAIILFIAENGENI